MALQHTHFSRDAFSERPLSGQIRFTIVHRQITKTALKTHMSRQKVTLPFRRFPLDVDLVVDIPESRQPLFPSNLVS